MSTTYGNLPEVELPGRWGFVLLLTEDEDDGEGNLQWVLHTSISAETGEQAEARALAVVDHDYEDDLRGAVAEAVNTYDDRWAVTITTQGSRR